MLAHFSGVGLRMISEAPSTAVPQTPARKKPAWVPVSTANGV